MEVEEFGFNNEHGIAALTPFVKKSFPNAKLVPIVIDETLSQDDAEKIGAAIALQLPESVVIGSMDMSHFLPAQVTEYHDKVTQLSLAAADPVDPHLRDRVRAAA